MSNEELKPPNFEDKKETKNNREFLLLKKIRGLEEHVGEFRVEHEKLQDDLKYDYVTGLYNRRYFEEEMEKVIASLKNPESEKLKEQKERREGFSSLSLLFCDIDNFKTINDTHGHSTGDAVLKKVSEVIRGKVRPNDIVCRLGGDEIGVALLGTKEEEAAIIGEKIRSAVEEEIKDIGVTLSVGVASYEEGLDMKSVMDRADKAMYLAKKERNNVKTHFDVLEVEKAKKQEEKKK